MRKKLLALSLLAAMTITSVFAVGFNYQTVLRDGSGVILTNETVSVKFEILQGSEAGTIVFAEDHVDVNSSELGILNMVVGEGSASVGTFAGIDWSAGPYYLKITIGSDVMGVSKLNYVPFASFSDQANSAISATTAITATSATTATMATSASTADDLNITGATSGDILYYDGTNWTRLTKGTDDKVLKVKGGALSWDDDMTGDLSVAGATTGDLLYYNGTDWTRLAKGADDKVLKVKGGALSWDDDMTGDLSVAGATTGDLLYYNGTDWTRLAKGADDKVLKVKAGALSWDDDMSGDLSVAGATTGDLLYYNGTDWTRLAKGADDKVLKVKAGALSWDDDMTGDLSVAGATTGDLLYYNGTDWTRLAKGADDKVLKVKAGALSWDDDVSGALDVAGASAGDVLYHNGTDWIRLAKGTDTQVLTLASGVPSWADAATGSVAGPQLGAAYSGGIIMAIYPDGDVLVAKDGLIRNALLQTTMSYSEAQTATSSAGYRLPTYQEIMKIAANSLYLSVVWDFEANYWTSTVHPIGASERFMYIVSNAFFNTVGITVGSGEVIAVKKVAFL